MKTRNLLPLFVIVFISCFALGAETNSSPSAKVNTNKPVALSPAAQLAIRKRNAIMRLNEVFAISRDQVNERNKISLKTPLTGDDDTSSLSIDIVCYTSVTEPIPDSFMIHFMSESKNWRFLHYSEFIINHDGVKHDFGELEVHTHIFEDATVSEQMFADFDYQEFHDIAYSKSTMFNLGPMKNNSLGPMSRSKLQRLFEYFDVLKEEQSQTAAKDK